MNFRDLERVENRLESTTRERDRLIAENQKMDKEIAELNHKIENLQKRVNENPRVLSQINRDPLNHEGKIVLLEEAVKSQAHQLSYYQEANSSLSLQLTTLQTELTSLQNHLQSKNHQIQLLNLKMNSFQKNDATHRDMIDRLHLKISKVNDEKLVLIRQKSELSYKLQNQEQKNQQKISQISEGIRSLNNFLTDREKVHTEPSQDDGQETMILKLQQQELQFRNEENLRLQTMLNGTKPASSQEFYLKNTIKHLRGELGKYNMMVTTILERSKKAESMIAEYEELNKRCQHQLQNIDEMKKKKEELEGRVEILQLEIKDLQAQLECEKNSKKETKEILYDTLIENQCYHQLMHQKYPENYKSYIKLHVQQYNQSLQLRKKTAKWVSVEQLIDVNQKLRKKVKLS